MNEQRQEIFDLITTLECEIDNGAILDDEFFTFSGYLIDTIIRIEKDIPMILEVIKFLNSIAAQVNDSEVKKSLIEVRKKFETMLMQMRRQTRSGKKQNVYQQSLYSFQHNALFDQKNEFEDIL